MRAPALARVLYLLIRPICMMKLSVTFYLVPYTLRPLRLFPHQERARELRLCVWRGGSEC